MALEALRLHEAPETAATVARGARMLEEMLRGLSGDGITELRGRGMMWALEMSEPGRPVRVMEEMLREGVFILPSGDRGEALSFSPPFAIGQEEISYCGELLQRLL
jgi:diaminobutyrate-2-oxoglutarate transaminase